MKIDELNKGEVYFLNGGYDITAIEIIEPMYKEEENLRNKKFCIIREYIIDTGRKMIDIYESRKTAQGINTFNKKGFTMDSDEYKTLFFEKFLEIRKPQGFPLKIHYKSREWEDGFDRVKDF
jgi:hypothetical protein